MNALRDVDDDAATTVMARSAVPPQSGTRMSAAHSEPPRDTIVDVPALLRLQRSGIVSLTSSTSLEAASRPDRVQIRIPL